PVRRRDRHARACAHRFPQLLQPATSLDARLVASDDSPPPAPRHAQAPAAARSLFRAIYAGWVRSAVSLLAGGAARAASVRLARAFHGIRATGLRAARQLGAGVRRGRAAQRPAAELAARAALAALHRAAHD